MVIIMNELQLIKGIGPKTIKYLNKLNIYNIEDLIHHFPFRYEVLNRSNILQAMQDEKVIIDGKIETKPVIIRYRGRQNRMSFRLMTSELLIQVNVYNRAFLVNHLLIGRYITVIGKWDKKHNTIIGNDIIFTKLSNEPLIIPIYHTTTGLNKKNLHNYIINTMEIYDNFNDYIPDYLVKENQFISKKEALINIHQPTNESLLKKAILRLKYEELFLYMLKINYLKDQNNKIDNKYIKKVNKEHVQKFIMKLPFKLTNDQIKVIDEIIDDMQQPKRMNRLIQGDVGSGKTIVSVIAIYMMYLCKYQSALMVPTEILARQHYQNIKQLFKDINIKVELLIGSLTKKEKDKIYTQLLNHEIDLIIGTHALIQENVEYHNLGLVITDEQHRFGVNQRLNLINKGIKPDVLYMSATPIPRTYALTIYGDLDISTIKTLPANRKEITTYLKKSQQIKEVLYLIKQELELGHQIYVVAPLIEESDNSDLSDIKKLEHQFNLAFGKLFKIEVLHGKLNSKEKEKIMQSFLDGNINILISTTVIEVGVDVPNATMMIIFDADRFGLSTIHQLRGRVGRSNLQSYCVLISDKEKERLNILTKTNDGFAISEADFKIRGQGDLFGYKQSGDIDFKIADFQKDFKILLKAKEDAKKFISKKLFEQYPLIKEKIETSIIIE